MFSNLTIRARLFTGFGIMLLFIATIGIISYWGMTKMEAYIKELTSVEATLTANSARVRANINMLRRFEKDLFISIGDTEKMAEYKKKWDEASAWVNKILDESLKVLSSSTSADANKDKETVEAVKKHLATYAAGFAQVYDTIKAGQISTTQDANKAISQYKEATYKSEALTSELTTKMDKHMDEVTAEAIASSRKIEFMIIGMSVVAIILALILALLTIGSITAPLTRLVTVANTIAQGDLTARVEVTSNDETGQLMAAMQTMTNNLRSIISQVADTSNQVAAASSQLHETAEQIATSAEEVSAQAATVATASEEMAATSNSISDSCHHAADSAGTASQAAVSGSGVVSSTIVGMERIAGRVHSSAQTVDALGERSDQIGAIVATIEDIADQTNLLALNAAIEAARAGEQGRGFAVVADEVRALAERTTKATREIGEMIKSIQNETKNAVVEMEQGVKEVQQGSEDAARSGEALQEILAKINEVAMEVNQVATAAEEQTATTTEITNNIMMISQVVEQTATGSQQAVRAADNLSSLASNLKQIVSQFRV
jgi:methyl-accepting chemotaxis protein